MVVLFTLSGSQLSFGKDSVSFLTAKDFPEVAQRVPLGFGCYSEQRWIASGEFI